MQNHGEVCQESIFIKREPQSDHTLEDYNVDRDENSLEESSLQTLSYQYNNVNIKTELKTEVIDIVEVKQEFIDTEDDSSTNSKLIETESSSDYSKSNLKCNLCYKTCDDHYDLIAHKIISHVDKPYACPLCNEKYILSAHLNSHIMSSHRDSNRIVIGPTNFALKMQLASDLILLERQTDNQHYKSLRATTKTSAEVDSKIHMCIRTSGQKIDKKPFTCPDCLFVSMSKIELLHHRNNSCINLHIDKKKQIVIAPDGVNVSYKCKVCGKLFLRLKSLNGHLKTHSTKVVYKNRTQGIISPNAENRSCRCEICGKLFFTLKSLNSHLKVHNKKSKFKTIGQNVGNMSYSCHLCGKSFLKCQSLNGHLKIHSVKFNYKNKCPQQNFSPNVNNWSYDCNICGQSFLKLNLLNAHLTTHNTQIKYKNVKSIKKNYKQIEGMVKKIKTENSITLNNSLKHVCEFCHKIYYTSKALKVHRRMHLKKNVCKICNKVFFLMANYKNHLLTHHTEKQNNVQTLLSQLPTNKETKPKPLKLKLVLTKSDSDPLGKPYQCSYCSIRFSSTTYLQVHYKKFHANTQKWKIKPKISKSMCKLCGRSYSSTSNLCRHTRIHHKNYFSC
ncbi:zinc finger protein 699-like [Adelges cooleyi]|uniref:zinc finger protein 699-like n=1 Tax=Adelges cooleyi TaxID=133065 RepID=UPI0021805342|nr:zinc finger protein 699-like [Adelges cooleyi]XP_050424129.1 zinc finger protein 699-like [Adelges cooleyi]